MSSARVSVLMPVRNGERWLEAAIASVLVQTFSDFELLVIDDGSTDRTPDIVAAGAKSDARLRPIRQDALGLVAALNRGIAEASGELIARLDADDLASPERLQTQVAAMDESPRLDLVGSWAETIDENGAAIGRLTPPFEPWTLRDILLRTNPFIHSSIMMRTEAVRAVGGYRAAFEAAEDYDLWLRLSEKGDIAILPQVLVRYREHGGNVTARKASRQLFSARLALRAAASRVSIGVDPADGLKAPPDWRADVGNTFYASDASIFRFLELADPDVGAVVRTGLEDFQAAIAAELNHRERGLAQRAILNLLRTRKRPTDLGVVRLLRALFALHPARAFALLWGREPQ